MIIGGKNRCPACKGNLKYYDKVFRIVRRKAGITEKMEICRMKCMKCGKIHREIPGHICPYKQYEMDIVRGVLEGLITCETLGYEDYPCEMTMIRWKKARSLQILL